MVSFKRLSWNCRCIDMTAGISYRIWRCGVHRLTCTVLQQHPARFMDLEPQPGLTQVQPSHTPFLRQGKSEQKPCLVPSPELEPYRHTS